VTTDREKTLKKAIRAIKRRDYTRKDIEKAVRTVYGTSYGLDAEYTKGVPEYEGQCEN
jgi:hypothetical protein